jgi:arylsulfatase A-like enzyme
MTSRRRFALLLVAAMAVGAASWRHSHLTRTHVILITLDTTRADRLSPYGYMDADMPAFERIAAEGVVFDRAYTPTPLTLPAHTSLFTGLLPPRHGVRDNSATPLEARHTTLAEVLRTRGYCTGAFVSSAVLDGDRGLAQGFEQYVAVDETVRSSQRPANEVVDDAIRWLDDVRPCPMFLWAHLYDPHRPYAPPEPHRSRYVDPYVGEIVFADAQVGRLLAALERSRLLDDTLVVVVADHGESLGEHGEENHGIFLYESVLRIPLLVRLPRQGRAAAAAVRRVADVVRLVDVMPTVLDVLQIPAPEADGVSLLGAMAGARLTLEAYAESLYPVRFGRPPLQSVRDSRFKLIDGPCPELYDLETDPFEQHTIHTDRPALTEAMRLRLAQFSAGRERLGATPNVPKELADRLRSLGYLNGGAEAAVIQRMWRDPGCDWPQRILPLSQ